MSTKQFERFVGKWEVTLLSPNLRLADHSAGTVHRPGNRMESTAIPEGWTDDMNVTIRADRTILELTRAVMERVKRFSGEQEIIRATASEFGLSESDAVLAFDRVQGGIIRALTARTDNCPDRDKDPMAWHAFA